MGAFGTHHVDYSKALPSMYVVDLAISVAAADAASLFEGMGIHVNDAGEWAKGCPAGKLPFITGQAQSPTALDVSRSANEMGGGLMGGTALSQGMQFDTTEYTGAIAGRYVSCPSTGKFVEASENDQIVGWCLSVFNDPDGDSVARIIACVGPSIGDGYSSVSSASASSQSA